MDLSVLDSNSYFIQILREAYWSADNNRCDWVTVFEQIEKAHLKFSRIV